MINFDALVLAPAMATFGEWVTYLPGAGAPMPIRGVFDANYKKAQLDPDGIPVITTFPSLGARISDFPPNKPTLSEAFLIRGVVYRVAAPPERDEEGHQLIRLTLADDNQVAVQQLPPAA